MISKTEFADWKRNPVTQEVFQMVADRMLECTEKLIHSAGSDPAEDGRLSGAILAFRDLLTLDYEETQTE